VNSPVVVQLTDPIEPGANGEIDLSFIVGVERSKVSAIVIREAVPVDPTAVEVSVADVIVDEDAAVATVTFTRTGASDEAVTITYSTADGAATAGADYTAVTGGTVDIPAGGTGIVTVDIPLLGDTDDEADGDVNVTITDATASSNTVTVANATATVTLTDNHVTLAPIGNGPTDDLDQDGIANQDDEDIDGDGVGNSTSTDGVLNIEETFVYDATDAGTALVQGETVTFDLETDGTPFEAGFTGALLSPNQPDAAEIALNNAEVSGGTLNINVTTGDHFNATNAQQNAFLAVYTAPEGFSVETRFAIPDYDNDPAYGETPPLDFQSSGVVIGVDQNNLVKAVYGRLGNEFEFAQDNAANNGGGNAFTVADATPAGAAEVAIRLALFFDAGNEGAATVEAFYTFFDVDGNVLGDADTSRHAGTGRQCVRRHATQDAGRERRAARRRRHPDLDRRRLALDLRRLLPVSDGPGARHAAQRRADVRSGRCGQRGRERGRRDDRPAGRRQCRRQRRRHAGHRPGLDHGGGHSQWRCAGELHA
jgi:hypothetical protein